ncbi:MAG TPA: DUF454 domain-containing protein [Clostridiaceae bacterium]|jgi:uncharacterized membrane protein YbaN (DUF454 family)|nr:DUF454 domain-containing protein [Clostridiaceae bacterium]HOA31790.1 YbaN family protein [Clostridia bacterium]
MGLKKIVLITIGCIFVGLGGLGLVLPVLPTTPFVLVASACFAASSPTLYNKLINSPYFGEFIKNYREKTGISKKTRVTALIFLWTTLVLSMFFIDKLLVRVIIAVIGTAVSIHLLAIKGREK